VSSIEKYLESFGKYVVQQARTNLTKGKKNVTNELYNSIKFTVTPNSEGYNVSFSMDSYGEFVDKGVSGNKKIQEFTTFDGRKIESPFKYRSKQPPANILSKWISMRGIKGRDKKSGRYITNLSLAFLIGKKIKRDGIKSLSFFQRPLGLGLKRLPNDIMIAIKEDILNNLKTITAR
jgi:hypothetical protein|tara:strand:+ start:402 stop:932 length:531 start_codon:yes stop_codon:yes gene_type:complete